MFAPFSEEDLTMPRPFTAAGMDLSQSRPFTSAGAGVATGMSSMEMSQAFETPRSSVGGGR